MFTSNENDSSMSSGCNWNSTFNQHVHDTLVPNIHGTDKRHKHNGS